MTDCGGGFGSHFDGHLGRKTKLTLICEEADTAPVSLLVLASVQISSCFIFFDKALENCFVVLFFLNMPVCR